MCMHPQVHTMVLWVSRCFGCSWFFVFPYILELISHPSIFQNHIFSTGTHKILCSFHVHNRGLNTILVCWWASNLYREPESPGTCRCPPELHRHTWDHKNVRQAKKRRPHLDKSHRFRLREFGGRFDSILKTIMHGFFTKLLKRMHCTGFFGFYNLLKVNGHFFWQWNLDLVWIKDVLPLVWSLCSLTSEELSLFLGTQTMGWSSPWTRCQSISAHTCTRRTFRAIQSHQFT